MKKIIRIIGFGLFAINSFGQTNEAEKFSFSIQQAIDYAMENQYNIKNSKIDQELAQEKVSEITGLGLPQINSSFDTKDFLIVPTTVIPLSFIQPGASGIYPVKMGVQYQSSAGLNASQLLFSGDYFLGLLASKVFVELSSKSIQRTKIETMAAVSKAYYTVLINEERINLTDANIKRVKASLDGTQGLYLTGFAEKIDVDRLTVTYNNLLVDKENIGRLLTLSTYLLKYQMGMDVNAPLTLTEKLNDVKFDVNNNITAEKFDYSKRVEFSLLETQHRIAELDLKRNRFSYLPNASAYGSLNKSAMNPKYFLNDIQQKWYPNSIIGATVTMPIFTGLQRNAKNQQSKLSLQKTENNMELLKKSIDIELATSMTMLQNAAASLINQKKNIEVAENVYRVSRIKYEQGVGSYIEMLTAETSLQESQTNYFSALFNALVAKIDFDKANGALISK